MDWPVDIFVVIPSYKAARWLPHLVAELRQVVPLDQIVVVDDASGDGTDAYCISAGVACCVHPVNRGKGASLMTGFAHAIDRGARWIITMDADGQHAVSDIPKFAEACRSGDPVAIWIGRRDMRPGRMPIARILSNTITSGILSLVIGRRILDSQCGYRAYNVAFVKDLRVDCQRFEMESEVIIRAARSGWDVRFLGIKTLYQGEESHIAHVLDTLRWVRAVVLVWWGSRGRIRG